MDEGKTRKSLASSKKRQPAISAIFVSNAQLSVDSRVGAQVDGEPLSANQPVRQITPATSPRVEPMAKSSERPHKQAKEQKPQPLQALSRDFSTIRFTHFFESRAPGRQMDEVGAYNTYGVLTRPFKCNGVFHGSYTIRSMMIPTNERRDNKEWRSALFILKEGDWKPFSRANNDGKQQPVFRKHSGLTKSSSFFLDLLRPEVRATLTISKTNNRWIVRLKGNGFKKGRRSLLQKR